MRINIKNLIVLILLIGCDYTCPSGLCIVSDNDTLTHTIQKNGIHGCQNKKLMDYFFSREYGKALIEQNYEPTEKETETIDRNFAIYYRFLSIISGLDTPYNYESIYVYNMSPELIYDSRNIQLIEWYDNNRDSISCELFNEYYQLENDRLGGVGKLIILTTDNFEQMEKFLDDYYDSLMKRFNDFKKNYSPKKTD